MISSSHLFCSTCPSNQKADVLCSDGVIVASSLTSLLQHAEPEWLHGWRFCCWELHLPRWQRWCPRTYGRVWRHSYSRAGGGHFICCKMTIWHTECVSFGIPPSFVRGDVATDESAHWEAVLSPWELSEWSAPCRWCPINASGCDGETCLAAALHMGSRFQCHAGLCDWQKIETPAYFCVQWASNCPTLSFISKLSWRFMLSSAPPGSPGAPGNPLCKVCV